MFQQVSAEEARLKEKATGCRNGIKSHKSRLSFQSFFSFVMGTEEQKKPFLVSMGWFHLTSAVWATSRGNFMIMVARADWPAWTTDSLDGQIHRAPFWGCDHSSSVIPSVLRQVCWGPVLELNGREWFPVTHILNTLNTKKMPQGRSRWNLLYLPQMKDLCDL